MQLVVLDRYVGSQGTGQRDGGRIHDPAQPTAYQHGTAAGDGATDGTGSLEPVGVGHRRADHADAKRWRAPGGRGGHSALIASSGTSDPNAYRQP